MVSLYGGHSPRHCDVLQQILETLTGAMADEDGGDKGRRLSGCCTRAGLCSPQGPLAAALVEGKEAVESGAPAPSGPLALLRAVRDPDVARGIGFFLQVAKAFGRGLDER